MAMNSGNNEEQLQKFRDKFADLVVSPLDTQTEHFLKSFIFALGDNWKQVSWKQRTRKISLGLTLRM